MDLVGILDIIQAIQTMVNKSSMTWVMPQFNTDNHNVESKSLYIENIYNPMLNSTKDSDSIITNTISLDGNQSLLISGPNMGGKTTILRAIGLVYYLAMLGCAVPATCCNLSFIDCIAVRLGAEDDIAVGLSTFMNEMIELEQCLKQSTNKSIVIVDEFGRGTSTNEGMGLLMAILEELSEKGVKAFCATHFHEVVPISMQFNYKSMYMAVLEENNQVVLTYKMIEGQSNKS